MTIALLAPCLAQALRPKLIEAIVRHGARLGLDLATPASFSCCGLPAWDAGHVQAASAAARLTVDTFGRYDAVVTPSPACLRMLRRHIPALLPGEPDAAALAGRSLSWSRFLLDHVGASRVGRRFDGRIAYFSTCTNDDEAADLALLANIEAASLTIAPGQGLGAGAPQQCCGYGNNLAWRQPALSQAIAAPIITNLLFSRADVIVSGEIGCLLHLEPALRKANGPPIRHLAEFLAEPILPTA